MDDLIGVMHSVVVDGQEICYRYMRGRESLQDFLDHDCSLPQAVQCPKKGIVCTGALAEASP